MFQSTKNRRKPQRHLYRLKFSVNLSLCSRFWDLKEKLGIWGSRREFIRFSWVCFLFSHIAFRSRETLLIKGECLYFLRNSQILHFVPGYFAIGNFDIKHCFYATKI